jgi:N-acetylneuraminate lyase
VRKSDHIEGLIAAPFTPLQPDGTLNLELIPSYAHMLHQNGVAGAFICGSTGEGVSLTTTEKMQTAEAWQKAVQDLPGFKVITLLADTSLEDCKALAAHAQSIGLYGVSLTAPYYFKPSSASVLAEICKQVAAAAPQLPFYYYHVPVLTGVGIPMYDLLQAVDGVIPNFAGIKYTHEDFMDFLSCLRYKDGQYDMLWGRDENMLSALAIGSKGFVGSTFNYLAPLYLQLIGLFEQHNLTEATTLQLRSIEFIRLLGKYGGIATGKAYMRLLGLDCGGFRLPVQNMSAKMYQSFKEEAEGLDFATFCSKLPSSIKSAVG